MVKKYRQREWLYLRKPDQSYCSDTFPMAIAIAIGGCDLKE